MRQFTFKRAKIRQPETWTLTNDTLSREGETINLRDVTEVMFEQATAGRVWATAMKITTPTKVHALQCNAPFASPVRKQFVDLCAATIGQLKANGSEADVRQGKAGSVGAWGLAIVGAGLLLFALIFLFTEVLQNTRGRGFGIGMSAVMGLLGAFLIWSGSPWKKPPEQDLAALHQQLTNIRAAMGA